MAKYRKKPVVIEATQWFRNGDHPDDYVKYRYGFNADGGEVGFSGDYAREHGWEGDVVRYFCRPDVSGEAPCRHCHVRMHEHGWIDTLEGGHTVCPGDFIITGVAYERYPCKPHIFEATYEAVHEGGTVTAPPLPRFTKGDRVWLSQTFSRYDFDFRDGTEVHAISACEFIVAGVSIVLGDDGWRVSYDLSDNLSDVGPDIRSVGDGVLHATMDEALESCSASFDAAKHDAVEAVNRQRCNLSGLTIEQRMDLRGPHRR